MLRLHKRAEAEIREAAAWYRSRSEGLDLRFLKAVREAFEELESGGDRFSRVETLAEGTPFRRALINGFPYLVVFEPFDSEVFVYAVAHVSRRPNYWRRRKHSSS